ncbi:hypothetical protein BH10PSE13_BH10PSE13_23040 [soil metagenome]
MTSDRMMQAIGRIERAISRLETAAGRNRERVTVDAREIARLGDALRTAEADNSALLEKTREWEEAHARQSESAGSEFPLPESDPHAMNPFSHDKALAALRSLDALIDDLQKARRDG